MSSLFIAQVIAAGEDISGVGAEVLECIEAAQIGQELFAGSVNILVEKQVKSAFEAYRLELQGKAVEMNEAGWDDFKGRLMKEVLSIAGADSLDGRREVSVDYRGQEICNVPVTSVINEIDIRCMAYMKTAAIKAGQLNQLTFEPLLNCNNPVNAMCRFDKNLLKKVETVHL